MKPHIHAESSAKKFGGEYTDYLEIHKFMDSSKAAFADNRHRTLTHNAWFIEHVIDRVFGDYIINSKGRKISTREIAELHVIEDFGYIPTVQDYLESMQYKKWMENGIELPPSLSGKIKHKQIEYNWK